MTNTTHAAATPPDIPTAVANAAAAKKANDAAQASYQSALRAWSNALQFLNLPGRGTAAQNPTAVTTSQLGGLADALIAAASSASSALVAHQSAQHDLNAAIVAAGAR